MTEHCLCLFSRLIRVDEGGREQLPQPVDIPIVPTYLVVEGRVDVEQDGHTDKIITQRGLHAKSATNSEGNRPALIVCEASIEEAVDRKRINIRRNTTGVKRRQVHTEFGVDLLQRCNEALPVIPEGKQFVR